LLKEARGKVRASSFFLSRSLPSFFHSSPGEGTECAGRRTRHRGKHRYLPFLNMVSTLLPPSFFLFPLPSSPAWGRTLGGALLAVSFFSTPLFLPLFPPPFLLGVPRIMPAKVERTAWRQSKAFPLEASPSSLYVGPGSSPLELNRGGGVGSGFPVGKFPLFFLACAPNSIY